MPQPEARPYQMIVGGITLVKDGKPIATMSPAAQYNNLSYKHVQGMWAFCDNNPSIRTAIDTFNSIVQAELIELGNLSGIAKGVLTPQDVELIKKLSGQAE